MKRITICSRDRRDTSGVTAWPAWHLNAFRTISGMFVAMLSGVLLIVLVYQIPAVHRVDIGGYDSAYVQGFYDAEHSHTPGDRAYLSGSDGSARWSRAISYLLFPQAGLPAQVSLRLRGWRASGQAPEVVVLLNGATELGRFRAGSEWEEHTFRLDGGLLKPSDVVIEIHSQTAPLSAGDPRQVGVLLDTATYRTGQAPIVPYPAQLAYGALAAGMLFLLLRGRMPETASRRLVSPYFWRFLASMLVPGALFFALYRAQPPYPYPLRNLLPAIDGLLAGLLALRYGPALARRSPALFDIAAIGVMGAWAIAVLAAARQHVTLSQPGVEADFRVFALRSARLIGAFQPDGNYSAQVDGVLRADGFYNLGYPFLLWLIRPLTQGNPFLAARIVAALSGVLLIGATWWLARRLLGRGAALLALIILALSPPAAAYGLYLGTDMPFAALCMLTLALLLVQQPASGERRAMVVLAGGTAGLAFLVRHPGILLLPFGWIALWMRQQPEATGRAAHSALHASRLVPHALFTLAFLIAFLPQLVVNIADTGHPFYSQQAKNIWLAVFAGGDWRRWGEVTNSVTLGQIVLQDPGRFVANWWGNVRAYFGTGGEDTSEFGRAVQLRLLGFPANWLAVGGLMAWLGLLLRSRQGAESDTKQIYALLLLWIALYVAAINAGLALQRFFLPLAPIYAIAAAWIITHLSATGQVPGSAGYAPPLLRRIAPHLPLAGSIVLIVLLWDGFQTGAGYVLANQPDAQVAVVHLVQTTLRADERLLARLPPGDPLGKYSAIAHRIARAPDDAAAPPDSEAAYVLWSAEAGVTPPAGAVAGQAGPYTLYRIRP